MKLWMHARHARTLGRAWQAPRMTGQRHIITLPEHSVDFESSVTEAADEQQGSDMLLFGANSVRAAILARKRSFGTLYVYGDDPSRREIMHLAAQNKIETVNVDNKGAMNNMSGNRPHNGFILECSLLDEPIITGLSAKEDLWRPVLENKNPMLGGQEFIPSAVTDGQEHPVYILLDEVTDPQNVGSVMRTAYFCGISGIVLSSKNCASLTPVVVKASSGATEFLPVFRTPSSITFIKMCQRNGWACVATVGREKTGKKTPCTKLSALRALRRGSPVVLVFGSEGTGLRTLIKQECRYTTTIPAAPEVNPAVDSLNIGVSVGMILASLSM